MHPIIYQASISGLFDILLIIVVVYWVFSFLMRRILPLFIRKYVNNFQNQFSQDQQPKEDNRKKEGEISIKYVEKDKSPTHNPDDGEYVDYEEIK